MGSGIAACLSGADHNNPQDCFWCSHKHLWPEGFRPVITDRILHFKSSSFQKTGKSNDDALNCIKTGFLPGLENARAIETESYLSYTVGGFWRFSTSLSTEGMQVRREIADE